MSIYRALVVTCAITIAALLAANVFYMRQAYRELASMNLQADLARKERINEIMRRNGLPEIPLDHRPEN